MELAKTALVLVSRLCQKAAQVKANQEDCRLLARFAQRIRPVLEHVVRQSTSDADIEKGLWFIIEALECTDKVVSQCCKMTAFVAVLNASEITGDLLKARTKLEQALNLLTATTVGITAEMRRDLKNLRAEVQNAYFRQTAVAQEQMTKLKIELRKGFEKTASNSEQIKKLIEQLLQQHSETLIEKNEDLQILKDCLAEARTNKLRLEEFELDQIIDAIESGLSASTTKDNAKSAFLDDLQSRVECPITKQTMVHPVTLLGSGVTYEQFAIEEWLRRGSVIDPVRSVPLQSRKLVRNMALEDIIKTFFPIREDASTTSVPITEEGSRSVHSSYLKPGLLDWKGRVISKNKRSGTIHGVLLLEPTGRMSGHIQEIHEPTGSLKSSYVTGTFDGTCDDLTIISTKSRILDESTTAQESTSAAPNEISGRLQLSACMCSAGTKNGLQRLLPLGNLEFDQISTPPHLRHYRLDAGIVQMNGKIFLNDGRKIKNTLVLMLETNGDVQGWMSTQKDTPEGYELLGKITEGKWSRNATDLDFRLMLLPGKQLETARRSSSHASCYKFVGMLTHELYAQAISGPTFRGNCQPRAIQGDVTRCRADFDSGMTLEFCYKYIRTPSLLLNERQIDQIKEHSLVEETRMLSVSPVILCRLSVFAGVSASYAGPGLCKIRMDSGPDPRGNTFIGWYLVQTECVRDETSDWVGWHPDAETATLWQIELADAVSGDVIIKAIHNANSRKNSGNICLAAHHVNLDPRNEHSSYVCTWKRT